MHSGTQRELPANLDAECALIGAVLVNNAAFDVLPSGFEARHFFERLHVEIWEAICEMRKAGRIANPVTVKMLVPEGQVGTMTVAQYLAHLASNAVNVVSAPDYARAIMDCAARRACITLGEKLEDAAFSRDIEIMDQVDALRVRFDEVVRALNGEQRAKTLADAAKRALASTADAYQGKGVAGVDYGLSWLMNMIGPFLPGQLIIVGGATKQGKSTLIEQIIAGAAINGHAAWVNSGEMKDEELAHRALSRLTDIQAWRQIRGKVSDQEYEKLDQARRNAETWQDRVYIRDDSMTLRQIKREIADFSKRHPGGMAVVDHIGLVEREAGQTRMSDAEFAPLVTRSLKMAAGECNLPIVAAAQLKKNTFEITDRNISRKTYLAAISRRPKYGDIFGSCEKDANQVIIPFRAETILTELEPAEQSDLHPIWEEVMSTVKDKAEIVLALSRHTRWPQRREVGWDGPRTMFTDLQQTAQTRML
ncbi:Replicative DNA helicase [Sinorhizobium sojae CCBAU 05684]|uniref:DNA 5'-3' helicase n=1 Tax=Sinorhizobium sojae CCBAU 05684 TaxID=716928 RepID=A0A249P9B0_9HYPH|nr:DnaB-like helicase C-terminal domain-containing protein [Sinorhizobium sojae]ASY62498.1 Replicative DNA helicase [Sinorhizobium sojae CCBAU 05684]